jgi:eukaryotic-like serine/threonine-protein kinase
VKAVETQDLSDDGLIAGKYRVERTLGVGGMGKVLCAVHVHLGQRVAIKVMLPERVESAEAIARFLLEGRAAVRLKSHHVGRVIDVGQMPTGEPYLVMEYYEGADLSYHLQQRGPLPVSEAIDLLLQACEAVAEAHALGIIHRDLKPANLFLTKDAYGSPTLKVLDFGISKAQLGKDSLLAENASLTHSAAIMGSPLYMSPEQMKSTKRVDARADIWALGVVLYELLTGAHPWVGNTLSEICIRVATEPAPPVREARPDVPQVIDTIIQRCLAKSPGERYSSVGDFARAIAPLGGPGAQRLLEGVLHFSKGSQTDTSPEPQGIAAAFPAKHSHEGLPDSAKVQTDLSWLEGTATGLPTRSSTKLWLTAATALFATGLASAAFWLWNHSVDVAPTPSASGAAQPNADAALGAQPVVPTRSSDAGVAANAVVPSTLETSVAAPKLEITALPDTFGHSAPTRPIKPLKPSDKLVEKTATPESSAPAVAASASPNVQHAPEIKTPSGGLPAWGGRE